MNFTDRQVPDTDRDQGHHETTSASERMEIALDDQVIGIVGLGYVGLPLAVEFGKIRPVVGFDVKESRIAELNRGFDGTREVPAEDLAAALQASMTKQAA